MTVASPAQPAAATKTVRVRDRAAWAIGAGLTLSLGAPPLRAWPVVFAALVMLGLALDGVRIRTAAFLGWLMGTAATLGAFYWIVGTVTRFTTLPFAAGVAAYVLMSMLAGVSLGVACALGAAIAPVLGAPAALATGLLVADRWAPGVFPWQIAAPLIYAPWIRQSADVLGVSGLGALLASTALVAAHAIRARMQRTQGPSRTAVVTSAVLIALTVGYGAVRTSVVSRAMRTAPRIETGLVQPVIAPAMVRTVADDLARLERLQQQTRAAVADGATLVIWSEAAYPFLLPDRAGIDGAAGAPVFDGTTSAQIITGLITQDDAGRMHNAATLREPDGTLEAPVAKQVLVPFGEYIPVVGTIAWVRRTFSRASGLAPGDRPELLRGTNGLRFGVLNCFEDTIPAMGAAVADTDLLVNVTNDAWFGRGPAPWQHLMLAQWRAIETGRELLRSVNTGVTARVDALGTIEDAAPVWQRVVLRVSARRMTLRPLAPWVVPRAPIAAAVLAALAIVLRAVRARRRR